MELADGTDTLLAEATFATDVPAASAGRLNSAAAVGRQADEAGAGRLLFTHLWPGTDPRASIDAARRAYGGPIDVATGGRTIAFEAP